MCWKCLISWRFYFSKCTAKQNQFLWSSIFIGSAASLKRPRLKCLHSFCISRRVSTRGASSINMFSVTHQRRIVTIWNEDIRLIRIHNGKTGFSNIIVKNRTLNLYEPGRMSSFLSNDNLSNSDDAHFSVLNFYGGTNILWAKMTTDISWLAWCQ